MCEEQDGDASSMEERGEIAYGAVKQLLLAIGLGKDDLPEQFRGFIERAVVVALTQHYAHLDSHCVKQTNADPYKLVSWLGCCILQDLPCEGENSSTGTCAFRTVADALIRTLCGLLKRDSGGRVELPRSTRKLLHQMLVAERIGKKEHGIWQNGLYAGFHCAVVAVDSFRE
jgi:hypothetical protein